MNLRMWPFIYLWLGCFLYDWIYHRDLAIKVMDRVTTAMVCITEPIPTTVTGVSPRNSSLKERVTSTGVRLYLKMRRRNRSLGGGRQSHFVCESDLKMVTGFGLLCGLNGRTGSFAARQRCHRNTLWPLWVMLK